MLWDHVASTLSQSSSSTQPPPGGPASAQPPTLADPVSGPAQLVGNLWRTYGPSIIAGGAALLHQSGQNQATNPAPDFFGAGFAPSPPRHDSSQSAQSHNRPMDIDTDSPGSPPQTIPTQQGSSSYSRTSSETDLRSRGGAFEEVDVPSDVEGYSVADEAHTRAAARRTSWFGWATGGGDGRGGYERVKND